MADKFKFDVVIGNPPYHDNALGDNTTYAPPIYHEFMEEAYQLSDKVSFITPARFLFNAGSTPKAWNKKMLSDEHLKIVFYDANSANIFPNTGIAGGVVVTYRDCQRKFGAIEIFKPYKELDTILSKVQSLADLTIDTITSGRGVYKLSSIALKDYPEIEDIQSKGHKFDVGSSAFKILKNIIYFEDKPKIQKDYVQILGLFQSTRVKYWISKDYLVTPESFYKYKVFIPKSGGSGAIGEKESTVLIGEPTVGIPNEGATETFLSIGAFETEYEAKSALKYIKGKFARTMLGILKITQDNTRDKWKYVPLQDFTDQSDVPWHLTIPEIDQYLYQKYGLSQEEIDFIEEKVKAME